MLLANMGLLPVRYYMNPFQLLQQVSDVRIPGPKPFLGEQRKQRLNMAMFTPLLLLVSLVCLVGFTLCDVPLLGNAAQVLLTLILGLSIANTVYRLFIYPHYVSPLCHLPGPKVSIYHPRPSTTQYLTSNPKDRHFLIGHFLHQYRAGSPNEPYVSWAKKWPDAPFIRYLSIGNVEALLVNSVAAYRDVTRTKCYLFVKPPFFVRLVKDLIGAGLVFAEGEEHKAQKKVLNGSGPLCACILRLRARVS